MADVLAFWATALVVGAVGFPFAATLLRRLPDAGAGLSFPLGLVLSGYVYFILRVFDMLPPGRGGYVAVLAMVGVAALAVAGRDRWLPVTWWRAWPGIVVAVGTFTFAFFGYVAFRSYNAEIGGTEQPMDLMYLNATLNSEEYPPRDPWLAGERASYYYFGYLQAGVLTSVSGVPASSGYNLSLAYTFGAGAAAMGSLSYGIARWVIGARRKNWALVAGAASVVLLLFVGSLSAVFEWPAAHGNGNRSLYEAFGVEFMLPCPPGQLENCELDARTSHWYPDEYWFWWEGSRIIPDTITEFPFFSFLLGDLHPHVMSIPLVLLALALTAAAWRGRGTLDWRTHRRLPFQGLALAIVLGALAFQNAWDVLTFTLAFALAAFARNLRGSQPLRALRDATSYVAPLGAAALVLYLPWLVDFSSQAGGLKPYAGAGTRPAHLLLQFGPILAAGIAIAAWAFRGVRRDAAVNIALGTAWIPLLPFLAWIVLNLAEGTLGDAVDNRGEGGWITMAVLAAVVWLLCFTAVAAFVARRAAAFPAALAATGALLLYGSELFLIKDVFFGGQPRLNTIFKLSYQAWILLSLAGGVAMAAAISQVRARPAFAAVALPGALLGVLGLTYPLLASFNRTDGFSGETTIDGLASVQRTDPGEYDLVSWIDENLPRDAVVVEASGRRWQPGVQGPALVDQGSDYTDSGRISARTGRATPIGWFFHEIQWRGENPSNREEFTSRQDAVDAVYISGDPERVLEVMRDYGAEYVIVGRIEMARYPGLLPDFSQFMDVAHRAANYTIYRLPRYRTVHTS